jgi:hypothetical protein
LSDIIGLIKSRRMRWAGHIASTGNINLQKIFAENLHEKYHFGDIHLDGSILKQILRNKICEWARFT